MYHVVRPLNEISNFKLNESRKNQNALKEIKVEYFETERSTHIKINMKFL